MSTRSEVIRIFNELIAQAKKISDLPSAPSVAGADLIEVSIGGTSYKATASQIGSGGSGVVQTIVAGTNITVNSTDPANPIVSATGASALLPLNPQTGDYQVNSTDVDFTIGMNSASPQDLTIPLNATEAIPIGSAFSILQVGSTAFTLFPESGSVTVNVPSGASLDSAGQGTFIYLLKTGTNTWYATGTQGSGGGGGSGVWGAITGTITDQTDLVTYVSTQIGSAVTGLYDDRGNFNASGGAYPSSGGSGSAGAILKGDIWTISVAGTLPTGQVVEAGDTVRALVDTPGNTQANWAIAQTNIGYTPITNVLTSAQILVGNGSNVATAVAMSGEATISNAGAVALANSAVIAKVLTGYTSGAGTVAATDTILQAIQKLNGNDALDWKLTGTSTLTGTTVIANGGNSLTFSGAAQHIFTSTVPSGFLVNGTATAVSSSTNMAQFSGTVTGRGTSNDGITGVVINTSLVNNTGVAVGQTMLTISGAASGSVVSPGLQTGILVLAPASSGLTRMLVLTTSAAVNRFVFTADGLMNFTQVTQGSTIGGAVASTTTGGAVIAFSHTLGLPVSTGGTVGRFNITGGPTTGSTNTTYNTFADTQVHTVSHTGYVTRFIHYNPSFAGAQAGTEVNYFIAAASGLSGFGIITPTARLQTRGINNAVAFLAEDDAGNAIASFGESGGARVIGFFGATPVVQQTMGSATAGGTYGATEQTMLQAVYDAVRNVGIGT